MTRRHFGARPQIDRAKPAPGIDSSGRVPRRELGHVEIGDTTYPLVDLGDYAATDANGATLIYHAGNVVTDGGAAYLCVNTDDVGTTNAPGTSDWIAWDASRLFLNADRIWKLPTLATTKYSDAIINDPAGGLVLYWKLDALGNTTADAVDSSGNGHTGTYAVHGDPSATHPTLGVAPLADGTAAEFDGDLDIVGIDTGVVGIQGFGEMSIECWVKTSQTAPVDNPIHVLDNTVGTIVNCDNVSTVHHFFRLEMVFATGLVKFTVWDTVPSSASLLSATAINDGVKHHIVATYDGTTMNIYVDGVLDATSTPGLTGISSTNGGFWVGGSHWQSSNFYTHSHLQGVIDEVALYTVALPLSSVQTHYLIGGVSNPPTGPASGPDITGDYPDSLELTATGVAAGTYGDSTHVGQFTVDAKGRISNATDVAIDFEDLDLVAAPAADTTANGVKISLTAGEILAFGDPIYIKSDGKAWKADANTAGAFPADGLAVSAAAANATVTVLLLGVARNDAWSWTVGGRVYLSTSSGLTQTQPSATDDAIAPIGRALSADVLLIAIGVRYLTHT